MVVDPRTQEIYDDIITYCDAILEILKDWQGSNDNPPGRMIYQCEWLKQEVQAGRLLLPSNHTHNLRHSYTVGDMPDEAYEKDIERYIGHLVKLADNRRIMKPNDYPLAIQEIDALLAILNNAPRPLSTHEQGMLPELEEIKRRLLDTNATLPLPHNDPAFNNFWEVYAYTKSSIDDILGAHPHLRRMALMVFEAVRD